MKGRSKNRLPAAAASCLVLTACGLLLAKAVLLTPAPIDINGTVELTPPAPLSAITSGAGLEIDVTSMIGDSSRHPDILERRKRVEQAFPSGSIEAILVTADQVPVKLRYVGHAFSSDAVFLNLQAVGEMPLKVRFTRVVLTSRIPLHGVKVAWRNFSK